MLPVHVLPDAAKVVKQFAVVALGLDVDPVTDSVTPFVTARPAGRSVQVRPVAGTQATPAHDNPQIDFLIWHDDPHSAMELALILRAYFRAAEAEQVAAGRISFDLELMRPTATIDPVDGETPQVMFRHQFFIR